MIDHVVEKEYFCFLYGKLIVTSSGRDDHSDLVSLFTQVKILLK